MATVLERIQAKVQIDENGCWLWTGAVQNTGYGAIKIGGRGGRTKLAHRVAYEISVGPIPDGMHLDHLCRVRRCVNPGHLEPVTPAENSARTTAAKTTKERHQAVSRCPKGHPYDEANTRWYVKDGYRCRACRACTRANNARQYDKVRQGRWRWGEGARPERRKYPR